VATLVQTFQTVLPLDLYDHLQRLRGRYATALIAAGKGDYRFGEDLGTLSRSVGHILAKEARKGPDERGGLRMLDISLSVDALFPELRQWTQHDLLQHHKERLITETLLRPPAPLHVRSDRAS